MTLRPIYNDIYSIINQGSYTNEILANDVLIALNDAISSARIEYVGRGLGQSFAVTEQQWVSVRDVNYPFLQTTELEYTPLKTAPITNSILNLTAFLSGEELTDEVASFSVGAKAVKQDDENGIFRLYECVKTYTSVNAFDKTFTKSQLRQWRSNNKLKYVTGDVVFDGTSYWKLEETFVNDQAYTFSESGTGDTVIDATQVYWMDIGDAVTGPVFFEFDRVNELRLMLRSGFHAFSLKDNVLYSTPDIQRFTITYVPEWSTVTDLDQEIRIPTDMIPSIKQRTLASLATKLNRGQTNE